MMSNSPCTRSKLVPAALALIAFATFAHTLTYDFTNWDDPGYVVRNELIERLDQENLSEIFKTSSVVRGNWAPLTILSYALDHALWGKRPLGYHLTNVLLHACCTVLLYLLLCRILGRGDPRAGQAPAAIAALLFAIHPVQVESVAWVSERKNVLGMFFLLAAFLAWLRATRGTFGKFSYTGFLVLLTLALLAKAQAVILPPLLVLHEWIVHRPSPGKSITPRTRAFLLLPPFVIAVSVGWITLEAQSIQYVIQPVDGFLGAVATAPALIFGYVRDLLFPMNRAVFLVQPTYSVPWQAAPLLGWGLLAGWMVAAMAVRRSLPNVAFFSLWYLGALALLVNLIPLSVLVADRYQYWAAPALFALAGLAVTRAWESWGGGQRRTLAALMSLATLFLLIFTLNWMPVWKNSVDLWTAAIRKAPESLVVRVNLSGALIQAGLLVEAREHLDHAMRLAPNSPRLTVNLAVLLFKMGRLEESIQQARIATGINADLLEGWLLLGTALEAAGHRAQAARAWAEALRISPGHPTATAQLRALKKSAGEKLGVEINEP